MQKNRLEAFSDGVLAIIITIMVLELKVPHGVELAALWPLLPVFLSYVLSFIYVGIYWNNHHHMFHSTEHVNGGNPVGELASALLAFALSVYHRLAGRKPSRSDARRGLRLRLVHGGGRVLHSTASDHFRAGARLALGIGNRERLEREDSLSSTSPACCSPL